jgi:hypothetical protein
VIVAQAAVVIGVVFRVVLNALDADLGYLQEQQSVAKQHKAQKPTNHQSHI